MRFTTSLVALLALTACGGGGGDGRLSTSRPLGPSELIGYIDDQERLSSAILASDGSEAGAAGLADSASFSGVMIFDESSGAGPAYYGAMTAEADFSLPTETLSGQATNFYYYDDSGAPTTGTAVAGSVTFGGNISYDNPETQGRDPFPITVDGDLEIGGTLQDVTGSDFDSRDDFGVAFAGRDTESSGETFPTAETIDYLLGIGSTTFGSAGTYQTLILGERD